MVELAGLDKADELPPSRGGMAVHDAARLGKIAQNNELASLSDLDAFADRAEARPAPSRPPWQPSLVFRLATRLAAKSADDSQAC